MKKLLSIFGAMSLATVGATQTMAMSSNKVLEDVNEDSADWPPIRHEDIWIPNEYQNHKMDIRSDKKNPYDNAYNFAVEIRNYKIDLGKEVKLKISNIGNPQWKFSALIPGTKRGSLAGEDVRLNVKNFSVDPRSRWTRDQAEENFQIFGYVGPGRLNRGSISVGIGYWSNKFYLSVSLRGETGNQAGVFANFSYSNLQWIEVTEY